MITVTFVTHSRDKITEAERILGQKLEHHYVDLPEIQSVQVEDVVIFKAKKAYSELGKTVMIEDTGLYIEAWNGLPGALIKWFVENVGDQGICRMMKDYPNRRAWAKTVVATYDGRSEPMTFIGEVEGHIALTPVGKEGFGWDSIFQPNGATKTFGEMLPDEKDKYSMRKQALQRLLAHFTEHE